MSRSGILNCILTILLTAYLSVTSMFLYRNARADHIAGLQINVVDSVSRGFVHAEDIDVELDNLSTNISAYTRAELNTLEIERRIMQMDNIERATCTYLNNGVLRIDVTPLDPLARVFDTKGGDYYINRDGKRMKASTRYRIDVPVIVGNFNPNRDPSICFPLLDYLESHPDLASIVSCIEIRNNRDIIIIPAVKGHVVNIGDTRDLDNKFTRLSIFYRDVMPVKGWEYYDTISVKWRGQIVAHQRNVKLPEAPIPVEEHEDIDDESTMASPTIAPPAEHHAPEPREQDPQNDDNP